MARAKVVQSSYLKSLWYDSVTRTLRVRFADGAVVDYANVSSRTYQAVVNAESVGEKFIELVRDSHKHKIVKQAA